MEIRQAVIGDLDAVLGIIADGKAALAAQRLDQWQGGNPTAEKIEADIAGGHTVLAVAQEGDAMPEGCAPLPAGTILGAIALFEGGEADYDTVTEGAWLTSSPNTPRDGVATYLVMHRLAVSAKARRRGVANALLAAGVERARELGLTSVRVDTHEGNVPMQRGFEKVGFTRCCAIEISDPGELSRRRIGFELVL